MSHAVYRELAGDLLHHGWVELQPAQRTAPCYLLAALPTVTQISRFALLAGTLGEGCGWTSSPSGPRQALRWSAETIGSRP